MSDLHTNQPDPEGYAVTYAMDENHEPTALIVTRLADDVEIGRYDSREDAEVACWADRGLCVIDEEEPASPRKKRKAG